MGVHNRKINVYPPLLADLMAGWLSIIFRYAGLNPFGLDPNLVIPGYFLNSIHLIY